MSVSRKLNRVVVILGPTASGKTKLSLMLAKKFNGEIISADSMQVYRRMDIGTSKPSKAEQKKVHHHLLDLCTPNQSWTLSDWQKAANKSIESILKKGKTPFLVGGTGLYLSSIIENYNLPKAMPNDALRKKLNRLSAAQLFSEIKKFDPATAKIIDKYNKRRLIRALEFVVTNNRSFAAAQEKNKSPYEFLILGPTLPREQLNKRIDERMRAMSRAGLEKEVRRLSDKYSWNLPAMHAIGYKEWQSYFQGQASKKGTIALVQRNTRNYAKRQMTWFRGMEKRNKIEWVRNEKQAERVVKNFLALVIARSEVQQDATTKQSL